MTLRDKIMDKYWLEFIAATKQPPGSHFAPNIDSKHFWVWFHEHKFTEPTKTLEDFV